MGETFVEYLKAALVENHPVIFLKVARNVACARGLSLDDLPADIPGLSRVLEGEIRQILGPDISEDCPDWRVLEDIGAGVGPETP